MGEVIESPCRTCPCNKPKKVLVRGHFPSDWNGVVVVGEQPWKTEAKQRALFVGRSGNLLRSICRSVSFELDRCVLINAISCFAGEWANEERDKFQATQCCQPFLLSLLASLPERPRFVLALGAWSLRSLTGDWTAKIDEHAGTYSSITVPGIEGPVLLVSTIHPSRVLHGGGQESDVLASHVRKVAGYLEKGPPEPWVDKYTLAPSPEVFATFTARLRARGWFSCDVETIPREENEAPNRWTARLRVVGIGDQNEAMVIPWLADEWARYYSSEDDWAQVAKLLFELLGDPNVAQVFHNMQYDVPVLRRHGARLQGVTHDSMIAHKTLYMVGVRHSLSYCAGMYLDVPAWKSEFAKEWTAPLEDLAVYNSRDVRVTDGLWQALVSQLEGEGLLAAYELDRRNTEIAWKMSEAGMRLNLPLRDQMVRDRRKKSWELHTELLEMSGIPQAQIRFLRELEGHRLYFSSLQTLKVKEFRAQQTVTEVTTLKTCFARAQALTWRSDLKVKAVKAKAKLDTLVPDVLDPRVLTAEDKKDASVLQVVRTTVKLLEELAGTVPPVNLRSDRQAGIVMHEVLGFPVRQGKNAKGDYAVSEEALYHMSREPFVQKWQEWKHTEKQLEWLTSLPIYPDGVIHQVYKSHTTPSCRYAGGGGKNSSDPLEKFNPQNIEPEFLGLFIPPPGYIFVGADFATLELRTAAAITGCSRLLEQFDLADRGEAPDLHTQMAQTIFVDDFDRANEGERKRLRGVAKMADFQSIYGGTSKSLAEAIRVSLPPERNEEDQLRADLNLEELTTEVQRKLKRTWAEMYAAMDGWFINVNRTGKLLTGYTTGRFVRFPLRDREHIRRTEVMNLPVQTTARELVCRAAGRIDYRLDFEVNQGGLCLVDRGMSARLCVDVHDELVAYCPQEDQVVRAVLTIFTEEMNTTLESTGRVAIRAEPKTGETLLVVK